VGTFSNCGAGLGYCFILGPLVRECYHPKALYPTHKLVDFLFRKERKEEEEEEEESCHNNLVPNKR
jgi:hypothetical protein